MNRHVEIIVREGFQAQWNPNTERNNRVRTPTVGQSRRTAHWRIFSRSRPAFQAEHLQP